MLSAFEAAARHQSFKNAADELNVTPGAVSHQVKALEQELDAPLFLRRHRGVELTDAGRRLFAALSDSFERIATGLQAVRNSGAVRTVTVGATSAVASLLLTPSISRFWREHGEVSVNQIVSDHGFSRDMSLDMFIRYGRDGNELLEHTELFRDRLVPIAHPSVRDEAGMPNLAQLASMRLIHLDSSDRTWTSWEEWFAALGYDGPLAPGIRVNNYTIALQASRDGDGVALGWKRLIRPLLATGAVAPIGHHSLPAPNRFYIVSRPVDDLSAPATLLRDWIIRDIELVSDEVNSPKDEHFSY